jgi:hypothetical protein
MADANPNDPDGRVRTAVQQVVRDIVGVVGAALCGIGAWMHYPPAGLMVGGGILVALAVVGTLRGTP